tara:strand:+ start:2328 stop:2849 length:522 start_codon:yes stop_codon:yes gene_type:complete
MRQTWIISDTHFNHASILGFKDYAGLPPRGCFDNVDQMNECMMDNWADTVATNDIIYHLGDVLFGDNKPEWLSENMCKLPGKKHLVLGNHDNPKFLAPFFKSINLWIDMSKIGLLLSHTPQHESTLAETHRFGQKPILNIHGHIHSNPSPEGPYKCVCVEQTNYKPINLDELL